MVTFVSNSPSVELLRFGSKFASCLFRGQVTAVVGRRRLLCLGYADPRWQVQVDALCRFLSRAFRFLLLVPVGESPVSLEERRRRLVGPRWLAAQVVARLVVQVRPLVQQRVVFQDRAASLDGRRRRRRKGIVIDGQRQRRHLGHELLDEVLRLVAGRALSVFRRGQVQWLLDPVAAVFRFVLAAEAEVLRGRRRCRCRSVLHDAALDAAVYQVLHGDCCCCCCCCCCVAVLLLLLLFAVAYAAFRLQFSSVDPPLVFLQMRLLSESVSALAASERPFRATRGAGDSAYKVDPGLMRLERRLVRKDDLASDALQRVGDHVGWQGGVAGVTAGTAEVVRVVDGEDAAARLALALHARLGRVGRRRRRVLVALRSSHAWRLFHLPLVSLG